MSIDVAPPFRIGTVRTHLHRARDYQDAASPAERFADALLDQAETAVTTRGKTSFTRAELAAMFEAAEQAVALAVEACASGSCDCGHLWAEHVGRAGCLGCDGCRERRPEREVSWTPLALPTPAEVAQAYDADDRHFPQGGAR
jgi:hypothetical protein